MKRTIMLAAVVAFVRLTGLSQKEVALQEIEHKVPLAVFDQLAIDGQFNLVLVENEEPAICLKGNRRFVKAFKVRQFNKKVVVSSRYTEGEADNNLVVINVNDLRSLVVLQDSKINAIGMVWSPEIRAILDAECLVTVKKGDASKIKTSENYRLFPAADDYQRRFHFK